MQDNQPALDARKKLWRFAGTVLVCLCVFFVVDRAGHAALLKGLDRYFGLNTPGSVLLVGHSHTVLGLDKIALETELGLPVSKYARAGAGLEDRITMARHYMALHPPGPRAIVFGVDAHLFNDRGLASSAHRLFYPHLDDPVIADYLSRKAQTPRERRIRQAFHLRRYNDVLLNAARRGWSQNWQSSVSGRFDPARLAQRAALGDFRRIGIAETQIAAFEDFLDRTGAENIPVILTFIPTSAPWNALEPEKFRTVHKMFDTFAQTYEHVHFIDMITPYDTQTELFADPIHLNRRGQRIVTADLAQRILPLVTEDQ